MPAMKSRKRLPSTSSTTARSPRATASGYSLGYDVDAKRSSRATIGRAFGPGGGTTMRGYSRAGVGVIDRFRSRRNRQLWDRRLDRLRHLPHKVVARAYG